MSKSIFQFADKFGYESPFGDWISEIPKPQHKIVNVEILKNDKAIQLNKKLKHLDLSNKLPIMVFVTCNTKPYEVKVTYEKRTSTMSFNYLENRYEAFFIINFLPPFNEKTCEFRIEVKNSYKEVTDTRAINQKFSLPSSITSPKKLNRKTTYNVFYFNKHQVLIDARVDKSKNVIPHAVYTNTAGHDAKIVLQDPENDPLQFSGVLEEGDKSDFRFKKPAVTALQFLLKKEFDAILKVNNIFLSKMKIQKEYNSRRPKNPPFVNIFIKANDKKFNTDDFIKLVANGLDYGPDMMKEEIMYVIKNTYKSYEKEFDYIGFNAKNMGNFIFGMIFQIFGYSWQNALSLAHGWNLKKHSAFDSKDDQFAIMMGFLKALKLYGEPTNKREVKYLDLIIKHYNDE